MTVKPGLSLGGYVAFARYAGGTMLMGDLVVTESEVANVTGALQANGIAQTAHACLAGQPPFQGTPPQAAAAHQRLPLPPLPAQVPAPVAALGSADEANS